MPILDDAGGWETHHKCPCKRKAGRVLDRGGGRSHVITEAEPGVMGPQAKEGPEKGQQSPKVGRSKK